MASGAIKGTLSGAVTGATLGASLGGPVGAAIGARIGALVGFGLSFFDDDSAERAREANLQAQAKALESSAVGRKIQARKERFAGKVEGLMIGRKLASARSFNISNAFAKGGFGGSDVAIQTTVSREASFFKLLGAGMQRIKSLDLQRVANDELSQAATLREALK